MQAMVQAEHVTQDPYREHTLLIRLRRIEGQVRGVQRMIEMDRECIELVTQLQAISAAADAIARHLLEEHVREAITAAIDKGADDVAVGDLLRVLDRAMRK